MNKQGEALMALWGQRLVYLDGGMGTLLQQQGLQGGDRPEEWNLSRPQAIRDIHLAYLAAGCDIVTANTFGATQAHLGPQAEACMAAGVQRAREAVAQAGHGFVAVDLGSLGRLLAPYGDLPLEEAIRQFEAATRAGLAAGADLVLIETMTDLLEAKAALLGARQAMEGLGLQVPLLCSLTFDERGRLLTGADIPGAAATLWGLGAHALGLNCGNAPKALYQNAQALLAASPGPVFISPNASLPQVVDGKTTFPTNPEAFAQDMKEMVRLGAWGLGGCCGTTPTHIQALCQATQGMPPAQREGQAPCIISGQGTSLALGQQPLMIGERLNPTGKPRMKQALQSQDMDFLLREAVAQGEAGAQVLDVNVGLPGLDEAALLTQAVSAIQTVSDLPLQLDTADPAALESALRVYIGRPLINSVCGKQQVMDQVFPLAARYGGVLVALLLDEEGIPSTVEGRLAIARRIICEGKKYGIPKEDMLFDALTMTVSTDEQAATLTLETIARLTQDLGVRTVLGVSNVSFGLPQRPLLTAAFTTLALGAGLTAAILNPMDSTIRALWKAAAAITGRDPGFESYLAAFGQGEGLLCLAPEAKGQAAALGKTPAQGPSASGTGNAPAPSNPDAPEGPQAIAGQAIRRGLAGDAALQVKALLDSGTDPLQVIDQVVMPALGDVGEGYEAGRLFLPQLLKSAQAAQAAFEEIRARLPQQQDSAGPQVVIATVQGDVHDIGKNIVKVLLQNYGFAVTDLGKDVPPQAVLAAVEETGATIVGLSALMTTTVPAMEQTIRLLAEKAPQVRVMVGGAVLTQDYADQIGAHGYGKDAMASVRLAQGFAGPQ